jgi:GDPmannose 4,6-dehydratase
VTGLTGQDGSVLAELLLEERYEVTGMIRGAPAGPLGSSEHLRDRVALVTGDLLDPASLVEAVARVRPHELYHLASPSVMSVSWQRPAETLAAIAGSTATLLEAVRDHSPATRVFVAATGAMFGAAPESPQYEDTRARPQNPYAAAKLAAHQLVGQMRGHDGLFACSGILYNHESERRPLAFVTRKITHAAAQIKLGQADHLELGDLDAVRDWSFAGDTVRGAWLMLQQPEPADYVLASGVGHTVGELAHAAFARVGLEAQAYVHVDPALKRAPDATVLVGDPSRARERLGWRATLTFEQMVNRMVDADLEASQKAARQGAQSARADPAVEGSGARPKGPW